MMKRTKIARTYSELISFGTFIERFKYAELSGIIGDRTFGADRYLNQRFYMSKEWRDFRRTIIIRDNCSDLAIDSEPIFEHPIIHHLQPITIEDIINTDSIIWDPENVICVSLNTHNAIHYGDKNTLLHLPEERKKGDTKLW